MKVKKFFHEANTLFGQSFSMREESKTDALKRFIDEITCKKILYCKRYEAIK